MTVCTLAQLNIGHPCRGPPIVIKSSGVHRCSWSASASPPPHMTPNDLQSSAFFQTVIFLVVPLKLQYPQ